MKKILEQILELEKTDLMDYTGYYNGYEIFKDKDINGEDPEIFIIAGNRTAGKTFFIKRMLLRLFLEYGVQTMLITRKIQQMGSVAMAFYSDLEEDPTFDDYYFSVGKTDVPYCKGIFVGKKDSIDKPCLFMYIVYINYADTLKESSSVFKRVGVMMKDEFQLESNDYHPNELINIRSIHKSVSRGFGEPVRYVPMLFIGNQISVINPYYVAFGIHKRLNSSTKKLRGTGWVLRIAFNKIVSEASKQSAFERAFGDDDYSRSSNQNIFMDNTYFIEKKDISKMRYMFGLGVKGKWYGVWCDGKCYYVCHSYDKKNPFNYALDGSTHTPGCKLLRRGDEIMQRMKIYFDKGYFYFSDMDSKSACIELFVSVVS